MRSLLLILLAFPVLEVWLLVELAGRWGWGLLGYLLGAAALGFLLIHDERLMVFGRMRQVLQQGSNPALAIITSAKKLVAGMLLILPGVASDIVALILLLFPVAQLKSRGTTSTVRYEETIIEGEWREDPEPSLRQIGQDSEPR